MTQELEVAGQTYQVGKLNALTQFHISRKLAPILAAMGISIQTLQKGMGPSGLDDFMPVLGPVTDMMAKMPEADVNYILFTCLDVVRRKVGDRWAPVSQGHAMMFEDIDMVAMLRLVVEVVKVNLGAFIQGLGGGSN